ncbi:protein-disulfide reductase DsbD domain-containing protein [Devosia geojensis]|uniref:protein-disulfide reductase DsbD domain-containing protein n=1 Tax=Devosia geojensis TaxID=443610 RepID=UPI0013649E1F|nr:protein-disulfide reductase DsbD domain-containing protein [Devosia geojensis]
MRRLLLSVLLAVCLPIAVSAAETGWQEVAPQVSIRLISSGEVGPDGRMLVGLEIDMPVNTKTYWRVPGETGIPTEIDISGSRGVRDPSILWPYPTVETRDGYVDYVYYGPTVLPVELTVEDEAAHLELKALLGICSDICIPVTAALSLPLAGRAPDAGNRLRLHQAVALAPIEWSDPGPPVGEVRYDGKARALAVEKGEGELAPADLIGAFADGAPLLGAAQADASGRTLLPLLDEVEPQALAGRSVELVFRTQSGAYSVTRTVITD